MSDQLKKSLTYAIGKVYEDAHMRSMLKVDDAIIRGDIPAGARALLTGQRIIDRLYRDYMGLEDVK